ncbi:MAG: sigma-54 dependent transcriptional regulator [Planctomycetota bacterium]
MEPSNAPVVYVDDERENLELASAALSKRGFEVQTFLSACEAMKVLDASFRGVVVTDVLMPDMSGLDFLKEVKGVDGEIPVLLITSSPDFLGAKDAYEEHAAHYLPRDVEVDELAREIQRGIDRRARVLDAREAAGRSGTVLVGSSGAMEDVRLRIEQLAPTTLPVLITGETGTGKELAARRLHELSPRCHGPFVPVNLGGLSGEILHSELFGHLKGSFTGALADRKGHFETAHGGTLFLDEVGELAAEHQPAFLRVLQEGRVLRLGSSKEIDVDVRVITATNRNLQAMMEDGTFRADLFHRLVGSRIDMPALSQRDGDVVELFYYFVEVLARELGVPKPPIKRGLEKQIRHSAWPGGVRRLQHAAEAFVNGLDPMTTLDTGAPRDASGCQTLEEWRDYGARLGVQAALARFPKLEDAAAYLGISARHLRNLRKKLF